MNSILFAFCLNLKPIIPKRKKLPDTNINSLGTFTGSVPDFQVNTVAKSSKAEIKLPTKFSYFVFRIVEIYQIEGQNPAPYEEGTGFRF